MSARRFREQDPFYIKKGSIKPVYDAQLVDFAGTARERPIDLSEATEVLFVMTRRGEDTPKFAKAMTFVSRPEGRVRLAWESSHVDEAGIYGAMFVVTWPDGPEKIPSRGFNRVVVGESPDIPG